jgi:endonuclease/exonuclease/phosphatase (EEP) superfamily protein YafD
LVKSVIRQDASAKIIVGGDLNGQLQRVHTALLLAGFAPALKAGTMTHREGSQLDQLWTRNITILKAIVADPID